MSIIYIQYLYRCLNPYRKTRIHKNNKEYIPSPLSKCMNINDIITENLKIKEQQEKLAQELENKKMLLEELSQSLKSEDLFFMDEIDNNKQDDKIDDDVLDIIYDDNEDGLIFQIQEL